MNTNVKSYFVLSDEQLLSLPAFLWSWINIDWSKNMSLPVSTRMLQVSWILGHCCIQGWALMYKNLQAIMPAGIVRRAGQSLNSCIYLFFKWVQIHQRDWFWSVSFFFFFVFWPCPQSQCLACLGFQRRASKVKWRHLSGCLLLAFSTPSVLLHTVLAGRCGTERERYRYKLAYSHNKAAIVCFWSTFSRLLRCPRLIKVMPSCLQIRYSCASASSVRALVASSKTAKIKDRKRKKLI